MIMRWSTSPSGPLGRQERSESCPLQIRQLVPSCAISLLLLVHTSSLLPFCQQALVLQ